MRSSFDVQQPHQKLRTSSTAISKISLKESNACTKRDPLYLFACHLEWRQAGSVAAYQELISALDDANPAIRAVAENLLHRSSPRPNESVCDEAEKW